MPGGGQAHDELARRILDCALELGEAQGWERLHLHEIALSLDIRLVDIQTCYGQKDDLVEAWFDRADQAAVALRDSADFRALPLSERLEHVVLVWLSALQPHRRLTREMLCYKLEPGHVHLQAQALMRISRTVQWFRETAQQDSTGIRRIVDEVLLTGAYLSTFIRWLYADSADAVRTRDFLHRALQAGPCLCPGGWCRDRQVVADSGANGQQGISA